MTSTGKKATSKTTSTVPLTSSEKWDVAKLIKQFGPAKRIDRDRETVLLNKGKWLHILTVMYNDVSYEDLKERDRPSDKELKERGETKEEFSMCQHYASPGHHLANMQEIYEFKKPIPEDVDLQDEDIWFGEDGLPHS